MMPASAAQAPSYADLHMQYVALPPLYDPMTIDCAESGPCYHPPSYNALQLESALSLYAEQQQRVRNLVPISPQQRPAGTPPPPYEAIDLTSNGYGRLDQRPPREPSTPQQSRLQTPEVVPDYGSTYLTETENPSVAEPSPGHRIQQTSQQSLESPSAPRMPWPWNKLDSGDRCCCCLIGIIPGGIAFIMLTGNIFTYITTTDVKLRLGKF